MIATLLTTDGKPTNKRYCTICMHLCHDGRETCWECGPQKCNQCGEPCEKHYLKCEACMTHGAATMEAQRFETANKRESWPGWVFDGDQFFPSVEDLVQEYFDGGDDVPAYCWATTPCRFVSLDREAILQAALDEDNAYDYFDDQSIEIPASMFKAIEEFNEANKGHIAYQVDYKNAVMISVEFLSAAQKEEE